jgi:hypothetical protein
VAWNKEIQIHKNSDKLKNVWSICGNIFKIIGNCL